MELQPPIYIGNLRIGEPTTALTDFLVTAVCWIAYYKLSKKNLNPFFRFHFFFLGLATFLGGWFAHAFSSYLSQAWKVPGWVMSTWAVSLLAWGIVIHNSWINESWKKFLLILIILELLAVMSITVYAQEFKWAGAHSAFGLFLIVGSITTVNYFRVKDRSSLILLYGLGVFLISGLVFSLKLSPHIWFNHVDLTHVLLAFASWVIYKSIESIKS